MEQTLEQKPLVCSDRRYKNIIFLCILIYTLSTVCKGIYASSLVEIIRDLQITKAEAGYVLTSYYLTYAVGQLLFGKLLHKIKPTVAISGSLIASALLLLWLATCSNLILMIVIWGLNGIAQAVLWPNFIGLQAKYLPEKFLGTSAVIMGSSLSIATVFSYAISSLCIFLYSWKLAFYIMSGLSLIGGILISLFFDKYLKTTKVAEKDLSACVEKKNNNLSTTKKIRNIMAMLLIFEILIYVPFSYLRHSTTNWLPNVLSDNFSIPSYFSVVMTIAVCIISLLGSYLTKLLNKYMKNYMLINTIVSAASVLLYVLLRIFYSESILLNLFASSLIVMFSACSGIIIGSVIPLKLRDYVDSGSQAAVLNACASLAVAIATALSGAIIDKGGYDGFYMFAIITIVFTTVISIIASVYWKKKIAKLI